MTKRNRHRVGVKSLRRQRLGFFAWLKWRAQGLKFVFVFSGIVALLLWISLDTLKHSFRTPSDIVFFRSYGEVDQLNEAGLRDLLQHLLGGHGIVVDAVLMGRLLEQFNVGRVHIYEDVSSAVWVSSFVPEVVARIDVGEYRNVSGKGKIFGPRALNKDNDLPLIKGLFELEDLWKERDHNYKLSQEGSVVMEEALTLIEELKGRKIEVLHFERYRGFLAVFTDFEAKVFFGRAPFAKRIQRLEKAIEYLKEKGKKAHKIELDYHKKAFITFVGV